MINVLGVEALSEREALANMLDALSIAENAARQLALYTDRPQWILVAQTLGDTRQACSVMGQRTIQPRLIF